MVCLLVCLFFFSLKKLAAFSKLVSEPPMLEEKKERRGGEAEMNESLKLQTGIAVTSDPSTGRGRHSTGRVLRTRLWRRATPSQNKPFSAEPSEGALRLLVCIHTLK